jgi:hypothetical protein
MRTLVLSLAGLGLAACDGFMPGPAPTATASPARMNAFITMIEGAGCELHQENNDALLDPAGFTDAEASALSQQLLVEGRAQITSDGNLILLTENCI